MTLKEKFRRAHLKLAEYWETGNWPFSKNYPNDCPLCGLIENGLRKSATMICGYADVCRYCTQHDQNARYRCVDMETFPEVDAKGTVCLPRAEYHLRMAGFIKTQPPERFHRRNAIKGFPEAFEIDREIAEGT